MPAIMSKLISAISWSAVERYSSQIVQFVIAVILARILLPKDYGILALVLATLSLISVINETGLGAALLQKLDRDKLDYSSVFYTNITLGFFLYFILFLAAPFIEIFFDLNNLSTYLRIAGLSIIINSFVIVPRTQLFIKIDFKTQAKISFPSVILSGLIAICIAYFGFGVWSLILQLLLANFFTLCLTWFFVKWRPDFSFSFNRIKPLFNFAYKLMLARLINTIFNQSYSILIGKYFSPSLLGYFNRAESIKSISTNTITGLIQRVSTPVLCELQDNHELMRKTLMKFIVSTAHIVFPLMGLIFVLSDSLIILLLTEKWLGSSFILKILCPVGMLFVINTFNLNVFNATGKTDLALRNEVYKKFFFIIILAVSIRFGFTFLIISQIVVALVELIFNMYYTNLQIKLSPISQMYDLKGVFFTSILMSLIVFIVTIQFENHFIKFILGSVIGFLSYSSLCWFFDVKYFKVLVNILWLNFLSYFRK